MPGEATVRPSLYDFFGRGGLLQKVYPGYEYRRAQWEMAQAVESALADRRHLLIEAGTGTGKTLAYLVPALTSGRRVLVSTGTRNLQEQLVFKDIPLVEKALGRELSAVCLKGRNNYACRQKIAELEHQPALFGLDMVDQYLRVREWVGGSASGDRSELEFLPEGAPLWEHINARRETCSGQKCPRFDDCFLTQLHRRAAEADLVIVNHHLFFADLALKRQDLAGVLPPYEAVVFDEAHELEEVAGLYFGVAVSSFQLDELARDTEASFRMKRIEAGDLLLRAERVRQAGHHLLTRIGHRDGRHPFQERAQFLDHHAESYEYLMQSLLGFKAGLELLQEKPEEIHQLARRAEDLKQRLAYLFESQDEDVVYWYERRGRGTFVQATPIEVSELLREVLFQDLDTAVLTSATLAVKGGFDYTRSRLGLEHARELIVPSPFRYEEQALLYVAAHLPDPRSPSYLDCAAAEIAAILGCSGGRAFVLCTSYEGMRGLHRRLEDRLPFPILVQGQAPRHRLLEHFRQTAHAVLFATSSFWQGVDVQGEQLSCVIIDRLPFASPSDPLVAARAARIERQGENAFLGFQVPEAVLALKQGFGRLIRAASDRGVLALLDSRVATKPYGRYFLESLPPCARTTAIEDVRRFFGGEGQPAEIDGLTAFTDP